jgi:hypothetical protein
MTSKWLQECGWPSDLIERRLSHAERNAFKAAYDQAEHLPERRRITQAWADHLSKLRRKIQPRSSSRPLASAGNTARKLAFLHTNYFTLRVSALYTRVSWAVARWRVQLLFLS